MASKQWLALGFLLATSAWAQTTTISGKIQTYSPNIAPNALGNYVEFALTNCGNNVPQVSGTAVLLTKPIDFYPDATGAITAAANGGLTPALYGNDVISCGGAFTSRYSVRYFVGGIAQGPAKFYYIASTAAFNLSTAVPITLQPPLSPPYPNLTTCASGQYTIGLNKDLTVNCQNLPFGANNSVVLNPAGSQTIAQPSGSSLTITGSFSPQLVFAKVLNGVANATQFTGNDVGAEANAAFAAVGTSGTVFIPAGTYSFNTAIQIPGAGYHLDCDAGTVLQYTGSGDAILISAATPPGQAVTGVDGHGGCSLVGTAKTGNGVRIAASNQTYVTGMRISNFANGINLQGANTVEITNNALVNNGNGISASGVPNYAANAVHVMHNEIEGNGWGYYSFNAQVTATRSLATVLRDNVFEGSTTGDVWLAWDAHATVTGNYFESCGVGVSAGGGADNVYDIHIDRNYFTANSCYRSEIELGYGFDFFVSGNYEEGGAAGDSTGCRINIVPGANGSTANVVLHNPFAQHSDGTNLTTNEVCLHGTAVTAPQGTDRIQDNVTIAGTIASGSLTVKGSGSFSGTGSFTGGITAGSAQIDGATAAPTLGGSCSPEGYLLVSTTAPAHLWLCQSLAWKQAY